MVGVMLDSRRTSTTCTSGAASRDVIHMHGQIMRALCDGPAGGRFGMAPRGDGARRCRPPATRRRTRPDIVWFGGIVPIHMERIAEGVGGLRPLRSRSAPRAGPPGGGLRERRGVRAADAGDQPRNLLRRGRCRQGHSRARAARVVPAWVAAAFSSADRSKGARPRDGWRGRGALALCRAPAGRREDAGRGPVVKSPWLWPWL